MRHRVPDLAFRALAVLLFLGSAVWVTADDFKPSTKEGRVTSIRDDRLIITSQDGMEIRYIVPQDARIKIDGKDVKLEKLNRGMRIRVTTARGDPQKVTLIEGLSLNKDFDKQVLK